MQRYEIWLKTSMVVKLRKLATRACKEAGIPFNLAWYIRRVLEKEVKG